jgi:hypothetical protein
LAVPCISTLSVSGITLKLLTIGFRASIIRSPIVASEVRSKKAAEKKDARQKKKRLEQDAVDPPALREVRKRVIVEKQKKKKEADQRAREAVALEVGALRATRRANASEPRKQELEHYAGIYRPDNRDARSREAAAVAQTEVFNAARLLVRRFRQEEKDEFMEKCYSWRELEEMGKMGTGIPPAVTKERRDTIVKEARKEFYKQPGVCACCDELIVDLTQTHEQYALSPGYPEWPLSMFHRLKPTEEQLYSEEVLLQFEQLLKTDELAAYRLFNNVNKFSPYVLAMYNVSHLFDEVDQNRFKELMLSERGIQHVKDPQTGKRITLLTLCGDCHSSLMKDDTEDVTRPPPLGAIVDNWAFSDICRFLRRENIHDVPSIAEYLLLLPFMTHSYVIAVQKSITKKSAVGASGKRAKGMTQKYHHRMYGNVAVTVSSVETIVEKLPLGPPLFQPGGVCNAPIRVLLRGQLVNTDDVLFVKQAAAYDKDDVIAAMQAVIVRKSVCRGILRFYLLHSEPFRVRLSEEARLRTWEQWEVELDKVVFPADPSDPVGNPLFVVDPPSEKDAKEAVQEDTTGGPSLDVSNVKIGKAYITTAVSSVPVNDARNVATESIEWFRTEAKKKTTGEVELEALDTKLPSSMGGTVHVVKSSSEYINASHKDFLQLCLLRQLAFGSGNLLGTRRNRKSTLAECYRKYCRHSLCECQDPATQLLMVNHEACLVSKGDLFHQAYQKRGTGTSLVEQFETMTPARLAQAAAYMQAKRTSSDLRLPKEIPVGRLQLDAQAIAFYKTLISSFRSHKYGDGVSVKARIDHYGATYMFGKGTWWFSLTPDAQAQALIFLLALGTRYLHTHTAHVVLEGGTRSK